MATKRKDAVQAAEREVERWRSELARLEAQLTEARSAAATVERARAESSLAAHTARPSEAATATLAKVRQELSETRTRSEELESALKLARRKLSASEEQLTAAQREAVQDLACKANAEVAEYREQVFAKVSELGAALDALSAAATKASGFEASLLGTYPLSNALQGRAGAPSVIYFRLLGGAEIAASIHAACRGKVSV